jgi:hypothetical protein
MKILDFQERVNEKKNYSVCDAPRRLIWEYHFAFR